MILYNLIQSINKPYNKIKSFYFIRFGDLNEVIHDNRESSSSKQFFMFRKSSERVSNLLKAIFILSFPKVSHVFT